MGELPSPVTAFGKLQGLLAKLLPIFGFVVGILTLGFIGTPLANIIHNFLTTKLGLKTKSQAGSLVSGDFQELIWWIPTGLILGALFGFGGMFIKGFDGIAEHAGNFMLGMAAGFMVGSLLIPFAEDIGLGFLKRG